MNSYPLSFQEVVPLFLKEKALYIKKSSVSIYYFNIKKHFIPVFGNSYHLTEQEVQNFILLKHQKGLKNKTLKGSHCSFKNDFKICTKKLSLAINRISITFSSFFL
ncbi:hypothetical protein CWO85_02605 [Candidatus Phytoplasma ziziphi]|uniref:Uncharacterized protein n=1 Tax=Ziziphus jujuba witches'-broom phytoplasma TaxID=135727 RepID=A0A660HND0_ZIZJU|nr:hypothetical protein [Candidatus Phytoplasma ziziphi]AYJ01379.1 hypothetical protein CWO85_02605 [Candidatus Phytoplasma ziziphi]